MKLKSLTLLITLLLIAAKPITAADDPATQPVPGRAIISPLSELTFSITDASPSAVPLSPTMLRRFEPSLLKQLLAAAEGEPVRGIVIMRAQDGVSQMNLEGMDRLARVTAVVNHLRSAAERSQRQVRALLEEARQDGRVAAYRPLWIVNAIAVEASRDTFWELATYDDVAIIREDRIRQLPSEKVVDQELSLETLQTSAVQWNVARTGAEKVWQSLGVTGEGVVVASLDSGVDGQHPALVTQYRGYTGKPWAVHEGNWYCATDEGYAYPGDGLGHGTHTMGTMVGQGGIGVAPGAKWIAAKVFNSQGIAYNSWIHDGFQWLLAPGGDPSLAPDVVNCSWGSVYGGDVEFLPDVRALRAAGILPVFSAGNHGPSNATIESPASYPESLAVGATDDQDLIAFFSSRGPSPWDEVKPEICAPGVGIVSAASGGALSSRSGTSMAAPHVAGIAALMLSASPTLSVAEIESALTETARPLGEVHPNDTYGWGLVDAYAAVARAGDYGQLAGRVIDARDGSGIPNAQVYAAARTGTAMTTTDSSGKYGLSLGAGLYDVTFSAFGFGSRTVRAVTITTGVTASQDTTLTALPTGVLQGAVREAGTNAPLRATLTVPGAPPTTTSRAGDGVYSLTLPEGTHIVRAETEAHRYVTSTVTVAGGGTATEDFSLEPAPTILFVDSGAWYNDSQRAYYEAALDDLRYLYDRHIVTNVTVTPTDVPQPSDLLPYDVVIWSAPRDAPGYIGASDAITTFLSNGGRLLLSGQDVAFWDDGGSGQSYAPYLFHYLKVRYVRDDAPSRVLDGLSLYPGRTITIAGPGGADNQSSPDVIIAADRDYASSTWTYREDGSGGQTVGPCLPYRALYFSFGLEGVTDAGARRDLLEQGIAWLTAPPTPSGVELTTGAMPQIAPAGGQITHTVRLRSTGEVITDSYLLELASGSWPTMLQSPTSITLGACQSQDLQVWVDVPSDLGWHVQDTATLGARSTISPSAMATASLLSKTPAPVLLVDGARFFRMEDRYEDALEANGIPYDYHRIKGTWQPTFPQTDTLATYPVVVWYTAYDWLEPLSKAEESRLQAYLDGGGRLFLSSQDYLYYGQGATLAREYLGVLDHSELLTATTVAGEVGNPIGWDTGPYSLSYPYQNWSDALTPTMSAQVAFRGQHRLPAGLSRAGESWRTAFYAFPFETLDPDAGVTTMGRTVGWLSWLGRSTWRADKRTVASGSRVTMTCVLRNDGWEDISSAHLTASLPDELTLVPGSLSPVAQYDPLARTVAWADVLARDQEVILRFTIQVADPIPDGTYLAFPAQIGYDDHAITFERPYVLRINAPDLSASTLQVEPAVSPPVEIVTYTLTVRNTGVRDAMAVVSATFPLHAVFTGTLDSEGIGSGEVISRVLTWTGPVPAGKEVALRYHASLDSEGDYWSIHRGWISDQFGEAWPLETRTQVRFRRLFFPKATK